MACKVLLALFCVVVGTTQAKEVPFESCGPPKTMVSVVYDPCNEDPCVLKKGEDYRVIVKVKFDKLAKKLLKTVYTNTGSKDTPVEGYTDMDACENVQCPIAAGDERTLFIGDNRRITDSLSPGKHRLKSEIKNLKGELMYCYYVQIVVSDGNDAKWN